MERKTKGMDGLVATGLTVKKEKEESEQVRAIICSKPPRH
jgi:hypothetical protein